MQAFVIHPVVVLFCNQDIFFMLYKYLKLLAAIGKVLHVHGTVSSFGKLIFQIINLFSSVQQHIVS